MIEIKSVDGRVLYTSNKETIRAAVEEAVANGVSLMSANLMGANLVRADLEGANLRGAKNADCVFAVTSICPEGDIIGYKNTNQGVVKLRIPEHAARSNATGRKCRASEAIVLETPNHEPATSRHDSSFVYREGETVRPAQPFDPDRWNECGAGIHFFLTRIEAERY